MRNANWLEKRLGLAVNKSNIQKNRHKNIKVKGKEEYLSRGRGHVPMYFLFLLHLFLLIDKEENAGVCAKLKWFHLDGVYCVAEAVQGHKVA